MLQIMKVLSYTLLIVTLLSCGQNDKNPLDQQQQAVATTFNDFFQAISNKDSTSIKSIIYHPYDSRRFWHTFTGSQDKLISHGSSSILGVLKSIGTKDSLYGKCIYNFDKFDIRVYHRYATVSVNYECRLVNDSSDSLDSLDHSGTYTVHFLKTDDWKVERVMRYIHLTEE